MLEAFPLKASGGVPRGFALVVDDMVVCFWPGVGEVCLGILWGVLAIVCGVGRVVAGFCDVWSSLGSVILGFCGSSGSSVLSDPSKDSSLGFSGVMFEVDASASLNPPGIGVRIEKMVSSSSVLSKLTFLLFP